MTIVSAYLFVLFATMQQIATNCCIFLRNCLVVNFIYITFVSIYTYMSEPSFYFSFNIKSL